MQFENILYNVNDGVATLTLNRPEVSNGFNVPMCEEILRAIEMASEDEEIQILLINAKIAQTTSKILLRIRDRPSS